MESIIPPESPTDPRLSIRVADEPVGSADLYRDGSISYSVEGRPRQNEDGSLDSCRTLIGRLNRDGGHWGDPFRPLSEEGVDCRSIDRRDDSLFLNIQHTRAIADSRFWQGAQNQGGSQSSEQAAYELAGSLRQAIDQKQKRIPPADRPKIVLLLDADELPAMTFPPVVAEFRTLHGQWAGGLGFQAIWVVGPTEKRTERLCP